MTGSTARGMRALAILMATTAFPTAAHAQDGELRTQLRELTAAIKRLQQNQVELEKRLAASEATRAQAMAATPATPAAPPAAPAALADVRPAATGRTDAPSQGGQSAAPSSGGAPLPQANAYANVYVQPGSIAPNPLDRGKAPARGKGASFVVPGTDTTIRFGGLVKVDAFSDLSGANLNTVPTDLSGTPLVGTAQGRRTGSFQMTARQSRFFFASETDTSLGKLNSLVEVDFYGTGGIALLTNPVSPRLRNAYVSLGKLLVGQSTSVFWDLEAAPETLDLTGPVGNGFANRQPLIRYQTPLGRSGLLTLGVENPEADFLGADHSTNYPIGATQSTRVLNQAPDLTARYTWKGNGVRLSAAGVLRFINLDTGGAALPFVGPNGDFTFAGHASTLAFGGQINATFKTFGQDSLTLQANGGPGIGRYMTIPQDLAFSRGIAPNGALNPNAGSGAVLGTDGKLRPLLAYGATAWYRHFWSDTVRSNIVAGFQRQENPANSLPVNYPSEYATVHANLLWNPLPQLGVGVEYIHGYLGLRGQTDANRALGIEDYGILNRLQVSLQYNLF